MTEQKILTRKNKNNILALIIAAFLLILSVNAFAAESIALDDYMQIDLLHNINNGKYGELSHLVTVFDTVRCNNNTYAYVKNANDTQILFYLVVFNDKGELIKKTSIGDTQSGGGKLLVLKDKIVLLSYTKYLSTLRPTLTLFDTQGNKIMQQTLNKNNDTCDTEFYYQVYDDELVWYVSSKKQKTYVIHYDLNSFDDNTIISDGTLYKTTNDFRLYMNDRNDVYAYYNGSDGYIMKVDRDSEFTLDYAKNNYIAYSKGTVITNIQIYSNKITYKINGELYEYNFLGNDNYDSDIHLINNTIVTIKKDNDLLKVETYKDETIDSIYLPWNEYDAYMTRDTLVIENRETYEDLIIKEDGIIRKISNDYVHKIISIDDYNMFILYDVSSDLQFVRLYNNTNVNVKLNELNGMEYNMTEGKMKVGMDGLTIKGEVNNLVKPCDIEIKIGDNVKILNNVSGNFETSFLPTELHEGIYDYIDIKLLDESNNFVYFSEIENGKEFYYNDILYTKLDTSLGYEKYMDKNQAMKRAKVLELDDSIYDLLLTDAEYKKYQKYIYDEDIYMYWLQDSKVVSSYKAQTVKSTNKTLNAYLRCKVYLKLNDKFRYNALDGKYYYIDEEKDSTYKMPILLRVSYKEINNVKIYITPNYLTNDKVVLHLTRNNNDDTDVVHIVTTYNEETFEDEITISDFIKDGDNEIYDKEYNENGLYNVHIYTTNDYGDNSKEEVYDFEIDKNNPEIIDVVYDNIYEYNGKKISNKAVNNVNIFVRDEHDINCEDCDVFKIDDNTYKVIVSLNNDEEKIVSIKDTCGNMTDVKLYSKYEIDEISPVMKFDIKYYDDYANIKVLSSDDFGVKKIYYYVSRYELADPFEYISEFDEGKEIKLYRKDYDRNTFIYAFAIDYANNMSDIIKSNVNLNSKPSLEILVNDKKTDNINFDLGNIFKLKINSYDEDNDELTLKCLLDNKTICEQKIQSKETYINFENYMSIIRTIGYNAEYDLDITLSDGLLSDSKNIKIKKENMKPNLTLKTREINFTDYTELDVMTDDLDNDDLELIITCKDRVIYYSDIYEGTNTIFLTGLDEGHNSLKCILFDGIHKVTKMVDVFTVSNESFDNSDIAILNIRDRYDKSFYNYVLSKYRDAKKIIFGFYDNIYTLDQNVISINDIYKSDNSFLNDNHEIYLDTLIDSDIANSIANALNGDDALYMITGDELKLDNITFYDYDNDYRDFDLKLGDDRLLKVNYDNLNFENTKDNHIDYYDMYKENEFDNFKMNIDFSGKYILSLKEKDHAIYDKDYSKESDEEEKVIYAHHKPVALLNYKILDENNNDSDNVKIEISKDAYDLDYYSINKGIKKLKLQIDSYLYNGTIYDTTIYEYEYGKNDKDMFNNVIIEANKNHITKVTLTAYDFGLDINENLYILSDTKSLEFKNTTSKPYCDFDYYLNDEKNDMDVFSNGYVYKYENSENIILKEETDFNDIFATNKNHILSYDKDIDEIKDIILNGDDRDVYNALTITNTFDLSYTSQRKKLDINRLELVNNTNYNFDKEDGYSNSSDINFMIDVRNVENKNDISLYLNGTKMIENEKGHFSLFVSKEYIDGMLLDNQDFSLVNFDVSVYSNRDHSYLGKDEFQIKVYNNSKILDFYITNVYDKNFKAGYPIYCNAMPIGNIKKGYAFDYDIVTSGFSDPNKNIKINVNYYYLDKDKNLYKKIKLKRKVDRKFVDYDINILFNKNYIGDLNHIVLWNKEIFSDKEIFSGRFYIPHDAIILLDDEIKKDGYILVTFDIAGYDGNNLITTYDLWSNIDYMPGETAIYTNKYSIDDDYVDYGLY